MADFFTNLVARTLGHQPAIRPRLPGLFEPAENLSVPTLRSHDGIGPASDREDQPVEAAVDGGSLPVARRPRSDDSDRRPVRSPAEPPVAGRRPDGPAASPVASHPTVTFGRDNYVAEPRPSSSGRQTEPFSSATSQIPMGPPVGAAPSPARNLAAVPVFLPSPGPRPATAPSEAAASLRPVTPVHRPAPAPVVRPTAVDAAPTSLKETPPPPAVQIRIGRIDVRAAVAPAAPARRAARAGPAVSLEDYLRKAGGK